MTSSSALPSRAVLLLSLALISLPPIHAANVANSIPLIRRYTQTRHPFVTEEEAIAHFQQLRQGLLMKYGAAPSSSSWTRKRSGSGDNELINLNGDASYVGSIAIGNPAISFQVILDTGSADLWLASASCYQGCGNVPAFDAHGSSSFTNLSTSFNIKYGTGSAFGNLGTDLVQMAGFGVSSQTFAVCNRVTPDLLKSPVSGLMGLGFSTLAISRSMPFWETLASTGAWSEPLMAFHLTSFLGVSGTQSLEYGGSFDMGFTNSSLYTGDIEYTDIPDGQESFWLIPLTLVTVQGQNMPIDGSVLAAIDTGTTLVGGPAESIQAIFSQIPGSQPAGGNYPGYWAYPCDTPVNISLTFGSGRAWSISPQSFELNRVGAGYCLGAFFELELGANSPTWIIGDTFLKNVYSVFRYSPPSVGFATLSTLAVDEASLAAPLPSPTVGTGSIISAGQATGSLVSGVGLALAVVMGFSIALC